MFANQHCVRPEGMRFCTGFCITVRTFNHRYRTIHATSIHSKWKAILVLAPRMTPGILLRVHVLFNLWDMWTGCIFVWKNSHRLWLIIQYRLWNVITGTEAVYTRSIYSQRNSHYYFWVSPVGTVTFLPDGARLAGSADGTRTCWFKCPTISEETVLSSLLTEPRLSLWL